MNEHPRRNRAALLALLAAAPLAWLGFPSAGTTNAVGIEEVCGFAAVSIRAANVSTSIDRDIHGNRCESGAEPNCNTGSPSASVTFGPQVGQHARAFVCRKS